MLLQALCIISSSYVNSNWSYSTETVKLGFDLCELDLWPLTLNFCMDLTLFIANNSWKFHDDTMMGTKWTRRSKNDNTLQALDQWMDSPFMCQQVGNCNSFTSTHYLANVFAMHCGPRTSPLCIQHLYLFHSNSINLPIPKIWLLKIWL